MSPHHTPLLDELDPADSYQRILPELLTLAPERIRRVKETAPRAVCVALGSLPHLRALRPRIRRLPEFDVALIDGLEDYALGLLHAHTVWLSTLAENDELPALLAEATRLKVRLTRDAEVLALHGMIDAARLRNLSGLNGYKHVGTDLLCLQTVLTESWPQIKGRSGIELHELRYAEKLAVCIRRLLGLRANPPRTPRDQARDLRARAFTLLVNAYDQARRAVDFLLWNDPNRALLLPPLYRGRPRKSRAATTEKNLGGA